MANIKITPLSSDLSYGARIHGVDLQVLKDADVRAQIQNAYQDRGLLLFEAVEPTSELQLAISNLFGPLQDHTPKVMSKADPRGLAEVDHKGNIAEIDSRRVYGWVNWHFDACDSAKLSRGGVLRAIEVPPEDGLTGFADGIQIYNALSRETLATFQGLSILYHSALMFGNQRFGRPKSYRAVSIPAAAAAKIQQSMSVPRSVHPAMWTRESGERVFHVCPWQAAGIFGQENPAGDTVLEALFEEMYAKMTPYWHRWKLTDMIAWDNWRLLLAVGGNDPKYPRRMQRTTIQGDYGLGRFQHAMRRDPNIGPGVDI